MTVYNLGSLNIDYVYDVPHFVAPGETLSSTARRVFPGGKGLNQSVALARAGARVVHGAPVGEEGDFLIDTLAAAGVDVSRLQRMPGSCGHAIIQVSADGQNGILLYPGTNHAVDEAYIRAYLQDACPGDVLLLQNETSGLDAAFAVAKEKGLRIAFNPSPFTAALTALPLEQVTWFFCNEIEAAGLFGTADPQAAATAFRAAYPHSTLVLTLGGDGSCFIDAEQLLFQPIYKVKAVDTTAAGDTFTGYFLAAVTAGKAPQDALALAAKAAAIAVSRPGASVSIPTLDEVETFG